MGASSTCQHKAPKRSHLLVMDGGREMHTTLQAGWQVTKLCLGLCWQHTAGTAAAGTAQHDPGSRGHVPPPRCHSWAKEKRENLPAQHCHVLPTPGEISRGNKEKARGCHCPRAWLPCGVTAPTPGETVSGGNQWRFLGFVGEIWDFLFSPFSGLFTVPP